MKKFLLAVLAIALLGLAGAGVFLYIVLWAPIVPEKPAHDHFIIHRGMNVTQIADSLYAQSFIQDRKKFLLAARMSRWQNQLKAGKYRMLARDSNLEMLKRFRAGKSVQERITLPEGKTAETFAALFHRIVAVDSSEFLHLAQDSIFAAELGIQAGRVEGYLFPNTYDFYWGTSSREIIAALVAEFRRQVSDSLRAQAAERGMTLHEIVTLASIIEGEAMVEDERPIIAAVYHNRLRAGILLQADPTIQYLVPGPPRRLLLRDLEIDSPYNTYRYAGLPPGPVNNPGLASIRAALEPARVDYLYFVARGDGTHIFSRTLAEHLQAKRAFDRVRAQYRREKKAAEKLQTRSEEN